MDGLAGRLGEASRGPAGGDGLGGQLGNWFGVKAGGDGRWIAWCDGLGEQFVNVIIITMIFQ